jgi:hypothetical protein
MNKNIKYFLIFLLPAFLVNVFVHEISHAFTAFVLGAKTLELNFFKQMLDE